MDWEGGSPIQGSAVMGNAYGFYSTPICKPELFNSPYHMF